VPLVPILLALLALLPAPAQASSAWVWPLAGPQLVSRPFAPGPTPYAPGHRGADLPGSAGQPVLAAGAGRVSYAGLLAGRAVLVVVHGALRTTYEPVRATVGVGQPVAAGQEIGRLVAGHPGCPAEACLHWGLRRGADYLDPVRLVHAGRVRLLPLAGSPTSPGAPGAGLLQAGGAPLGSGGGLSGGGLSGGGLTGGELTGGGLTGGGLSGPSTAAATGQPDRKQPAGTPPGGGGAATPPAGPPGSAGSDDDGRAGVLPLVPALGAGAALLGRRRRRAGRPS